MIVVAATQEEEKWRFSVKDNGIGIDPKMSEVIFKMFQRLHTAAEYDGSGLGLALCEKIVNLHGGTIRVESEPGAGATLVFSLLSRTPATRSVD